MKTKSIIPVLITLLFVSCNQSEKRTGLLEVKINEYNLLDVINTGNGQVVIKGLDAYYSGTQSNGVRITPGNAEINESAFSDMMGDGTETHFTALNEDDHMKTEWSLRTFSDKPILAVRLKITNMSEKQKRIEKICPLSANNNSSGIIIDSDENLHYLDIDPQTWADKSMKVLDSAGMGRFVTGIAGEDGTGTVIGCISFERYRGFFEMIDNRKSKGVIGLNVYHRMDDHLMLKPGKSFVSEWIYIDCVNNIYDGLEQWAEMAGKMGKAVISDPPAAGFYTWYYYRDQVTEQIMIDNLKLLAEKRDRFPVNYIHLDWGWQRQFSFGDTAVNEKFTNGLRWLAKEIKQEGFNPSLWVNPFMYTTPTADGPVNHPDVFMKDTTGNLTRRPPIRNIMGEAFGDADYMIIEGVTNLIDVSNPDAYKFLSDRYKWVSSMGYDMAMMDFVIMGQNDPNYGDQLKNTDLPTYEYVRKALTAAKEGLGWDKGLLGCGTIYETVVGISSLTRISTDAPANWYCAKTACNDLLLQYYMNNKLWTNYADGLFVRDKKSPHWGDHWWDAEGNEIPMYLTDDEAEFYTTVNGLTQAAVMFTEDITRLRENRKWLLSMVLPIYDEGEFRPVDLFKDKHAKTLQLKCEEGSRKWMVAAGMNWTDEDIEEGLNLGLLDLEEGQEYHVFDVFRKKYRGVYTPDSRLGPVNAHGVLLAAIVPVAERPQVVGTDLHISQGGVEISDETWDNTSGELTLSVNDLYGREGNIYIYVPETYEYEQGGQEKIIPVRVVLNKDKTITLKFNRK